MRKEKALMFNFTALFKAGDETWNKIGFKDGYPVDKAYPPAWVISAKQTVEGRFNDLSPRYLDHFRQIWFTYYENKKRTLRRRMSE